MDNLDTGNIFDKIGSDRINQTEIAFISVLYSIPFPYIWVLSLWLMENSAAKSSLNMEYVQLYYSWAPFLSSIYIVLAVIGWRLIRQDKQNHIYVHCVVQCFTIITFVMSAFFGFFVTPVSLAIIAAVGISSIIFDKEKVMLGMFTLTSLVFFTAYLHVKGLPLVPVAQTLTDFEGGLLPWVTWSFMFVSIFFIGFLSIFVATLMGISRDKQNLLEGLSGKLARYLSPQIYASIFSGEKEVKIETYRKKLTIFFSDIKSFTEITDGMESEALSTLLNNYLNEMSVIALKHGGTIDKFIGDAIMIFFGDPETHGEKDDALNCVAMAIEMRNRMRELQASWYRQGISDPLEIRIGINTGYCTVGNFGSDDRLDYTVVGSQVNLAGELEQKSEPNSILISQDTYSLIKDDVDCVYSKNINENEEHGVIESYEVLDFYNQERSKEDEFLSKRLEDFFDKVKFQDMDESEKSFVLNSVQNLT